MQITDFATAEHQHPAPVQRARDVQVRRVGEDLGDTAETARPRRGRHPAASARRRPRAATRRRSRPARSGRVCISTPTRTPWRTPTSISPRTTLLTRRSTASSGVHPTVEQQELAVGVAFGLLGHDAAQRDGRVWSLIWPSRARRGSVRAVSTSSVRADLLVATTAPAAERARSKAISDGRGRATAATREVRPPRRRRSDSTGSNPSARHRLGQQPVTAAAT